MYTCAINGYVFIQFHSLREVEVNIKLIYGNFFLSRPRKNPTGKRCSLYCINLFMKFIRDRD